MSCDEAHRVVAGWANFGALSVHGKPAQRAGEGDMPGMEGGHARHGVRRGSVRASGW